MSSQFGFTLWQPVTCVLVFVARWCTWSELVMGQCIDVLDTACLYWHSTVTFDIRIFEYTTKMCTEMSFWKSKDCLWNLWKLIVRNCQQIFYLKFSILGVFPDYQKFTFDIKWKTFQKFALLCLIISATWNIVVLNRDALWLRTGLTLAKWCNNIVIFWKCLAVLTHL